jgi:hypothetical protein
MTKSRKRRKPAAEASDTALQASPLPSSELAIIPPLMRSPTFLGVAPVPQALAVETHFDISMAPNGLTDTHRKRIVGLATKNGLPVMVVDSGRIDSGALISYGPNFADMWRRAATYVDTITVADSNAFMADLRGAALRCEARSKNHRRTKRAEPPTCANLRKVMQPY